MNTETTYQELKNNGSTVPRHPNSGEVIYFAVGKEFVISSQSMENKEEIKAICTQDCPCNLKKI